MRDDREDVYSKAVRAGKRTYFFDVKSTRGRDLFLTITESKKHTHEDGTAHYDKHKICLLYTSPSPRDRTRSRMPSSA